MSAAAEPDLCGLLGARLCHDLISPIGAIGNGVELLEMTGGSTAGPEMSLIADSVAAAAARVRFYRLAFGTAAPDQTVGRAEMSALARALAATGGPVLDWQGPEAARRDEVRLACLLALCLEHALARGIPVTVSAEDGRWRLAAAAGPQRLETPLWDRLSRPGAEGPLAAAEIQFALAPRAAAAMGRRITTAIAPDALSASF